MFFYLSLVSGAPEERKGSVHRDPIDILRVHNCSEIEVAGNGYQQNGKYYDRCCDLENRCFCGGQIECAGIREVVLMFVGVCVVGLWVLLFCHWISDQCSNKPQPIVGNDNNATTNGTERFWRFLIPQFNLNISTISDNLRQPSRGVATPKAPPTSVIQERLE